MCQWARHYYSKCDDFDPWSVVGQCGRVHPRYTDLGSSEKNTQENCGVATQPPDESTLLQDCSEECCKAKIRPALLEWAKRRKRRNRWQPDTQAHALGMAAADLFEYPRLKCGFRLELFRSMRTAILYWESKMQEVECPGAPHEWQWQVDPCCRALDDPQR